MLLLGFAASATAVVPAFSELLQGSRVYLAVTGVIGLFAAIVGVVTLIRADAGMLAALVAATVVMWVMATMRHLRAAGAEGGRAQHRPSAGRLVGARLI